MTIAVDVRPEVSGDFRDLPTDTLRWEALRYLARLKEEAYLGRSLQDHPELGDLRDCRKIFLDERHDVDPRFRIVYRLLPNETNPEVADVIIIGPRAEAAVYLDALKRLRRELG